MVDLITWCYENPKLAADKINILTSKVSDLTERNVRLSTNVEYFELGCTCSRNYKDVPESIRELKRVNNILDTIINSKEGL